VSLGAQNNMRASFHAYVTLNYWI